MESNCRDITPVAGLEPQTGLLLAMLDAATAEWRRELGRVSPDGIVWQPFHKGHSIGALILHLADCEAYWLYEVGAGAKMTAEEMQTFLTKEVEQYAFRWPTPPRKPLAWYYEQQDSVRNRTRGIVARFDDPAHTCKRGKRELTLRWLLFHVIAHESYHGGQAVLLSIMRRQSMRERSSGATGRAAKR